MRSQSPKLQRFRERRKLNLEPQEMMTFCQCKGISRVQVFEAICSFPIVALEVKELDLFWALFLSSFCSFVGSYPFRKCSIICHYFLFYSRRPSLDKPGDVLGYHRLRANRWGRRQMGNNPKFHRGHWSTKNRPFTRIFTDNLVICYELICLRWYYGKSIFTGHWARD